MNKEINNTSLSKKTQLDKSYSNYNKIINKNLPYKFSYLNEWLLKKSKILIKEADNLILQNIELRELKKPKFKTYERGTIIKADFGVGLGSEMSQIHFAIVLNNYDNPKNNILTVIPLTSKKNKFNLYLGTLIIDTLINKIKKKQDINTNENVKHNKIKSLILYYQSYAKETYACCSLITTISKERIFLPINEYDIIGRVKCSKEVMDKLDNAIRNRFTFK